MKTWITYLAAFFLALATALLTGDFSWSYTVFSTAGTIAVSFASLLAVLMVLISLTGAVASLRKDRAGGKVVTWSLLWGIVCTIMLPLLTALLSAVFPFTFPVSSTAGIGTVQDSYVPYVFANNWNLLFSGNIAAIFSSATDLMLPLLLFAFIAGCALKPDADVIKPAYITVNSFSEVLYRLARAISTFGYVFAYITSTLLFITIYQEKTFFVDANFSLCLIIIPAAFSLIILPVLFEIFTKGKRNPYKILYRNIAAQITAFSSGSYIVSMPYIMAGERCNDGVQKRIVGSTTSLFYIIGRGGSAAVSAFAVIGILSNVTAAPVSLENSLIIALVCALCSFAGCFAGSGMEVMFITIASLKLLNINVYSAELTVLGILPLVSGLASLIDSQIALLGASVCSNKTGTEVIPPYGDII